MFTSSTVLTNSNVKKPVNPIRYEMDRDEMERETEIVKKCQKSQFYQLVKNEPRKYLYLAEKHLKCHEYVAKEFDFSVTRNNIITVKISVNGEHHVIFTSENGEDELADDLALYITAKLSERSNSEMLLRKKRKDAPTTSMSSVNISANHNDIIDRLIRIEKMLDQLVQVHR